MLHDINSGNKTDLILYWIDVAKEDLKSAKVLMEIPDYRGANNRAYYSIYHAISAIHAMNNMAYKRHKDAIANFNKEYIKTEIFPRALGRKIAEASEIRHASDYDDFYIATKEEALEQIETAKELISIIEKYCTDKLNDKK